MSLLLNVCRYNNCGLIFPNLNQLIQHIEGEHISFDAGYVETLEMSKPTALPLSYVLPSNIKMQENDESDEGEADRLSPSIPTDTEQQNSTAVPLSDEISNVSESVDANFEDDVDTDDTFTFIMRYGKKRTSDEFVEKPFVCPMPHCTKRYKNINGLRYHAKNGHKKSSKPAKKFECYCGRSYKTAQGLSSHAMAVHNFAMILPNSSRVPPHSADESNLLTFANMPNEAFEQLHNLNAENNEQILKSTTSTTTEADLSGVLTNETFLSFSFDQENGQTVSNSNSNRDGAHRNVHLNSVFDIKQDENTSSSSSSSSQETSDIDAKNPSNDLYLIKRETYDNDEIDVGDANDTVYP